MLRAVNSSAAQAVVIAQVLSTARKLWWYQKGIKFVKNKKPIEMLREIPEKADGISPG